METRLLPPGSSPLELAIEQVTDDQISQLPVALRTLWNPDTCPVPFLPYLAWAFSVDRWQDDWDEQTKRDVIKQSYFIHRHKGTKGAIRRAVAPFGYLVSITEWWENNKTPGTFDIEIGTLEHGITDEMYNELVRVIDDAKPVSRHINSLIISMTVKGNIPVAATSYSGDIMTVYPYIPELIETSGQEIIGVGMQIIDILEVRP